MKHSPFQLEFVVYPSLTFVANPKIADGLEANFIFPNIDAQVIYVEDGRHTASLRLWHDNENEDLPFKVDLEVIAGFSFDLLRAKDSYKNDDLLPIFIAVNIARVLYSGARELLAGVTARSPYGSAMIQSLVIEAKDVKIRFDEDEEKLLLSLFNIDKSKNTQKASDVRESHISNKKTVKAKVVTSKK